VEGVTAFCGLRYPPLRPGTTAGVARATRSVAEVGGIDVGTS
jgi:hypothetical protein